MTKHNGSNKKQNNDLSKKMDQLLNKFSEVEEKMHERMTNIEIKLDAMQKKVSNNEKSNKYFCAEISKMKQKMNDMDQEQLSCDIIVRGIKQIETSEAELGQLAFNLLFCLYENILDENIVMCKRLGNQSTSMKPILIKLSNKTVKEEIMRSKKEKKVDCSMISLKGTRIGASTDAIYISDNLTPTNASLYYSARQLKRKGTVKFAWTKMGTVYICKDESSKAIRLSSHDQLSVFGKHKAEKVLSSTKRNESSDDESSESQESSGSSSEEAEELSHIETNKETVPPPNTTRNSKKRDRSNVTPKRSPRPKRVHKQK